MDEQGQTRPQTSTRDYADVRASLEQWLQDQMPGARVSELLVPESNGMSSETVLFTVDEGEKATNLVARIAPDPDSEPVFADYDMEKQFKVMRLVADSTDVPVPNTRWLELSADVLGVPFFVMDRVDGEVPPDVMPYTFGDNWFFDATAEQQRQLQDSTIAAIAGVHSIPLGDETAFLDFASPSPEGRLRDHLAALEDYYQWTADQGLRSPLLERALTWLEEHRPKNPTKDVLLWGDARPGNILYKDFSPAAVLDWEMACLGPPEVDLAWTIFLHRFFQDLATDLMGLPGLPDFMRLDDAAATYERLTGTRPQNLEYYTAYAAIRHGVIMFRISQRQIRFGEAEPTEDPDSAILHANTIRRMLDGSYWSEVYA
ncbi:MAG: phosphotransferase family protein [Actinomycetota bacterium]